MPWIARMPGVVKAGVTLDEPVDLADLYPTIAQLAGAPLPPKELHAVDGSSLLPLLRGEARHLDRPALYWHFPGYSAPNIAPVSVINRRHGGTRYKLTWSYVDERYSLYDVTADLAESHNLLADEPTEEASNAAKLLSSDLRKWLMLSRAPLGRLRRDDKPVEAPPLYEKLAATR